MDEARGLVHVDIFGKPAMEGGILYINLLNGPTRGDSSG
jgi:hypothetical protein